MSANLDLVRSIFTAWERGDFRSSGWAGAEIEFAFAGGPDPASMTGVPAMAESFRDFLTAWEGFRVEADKYMELDDERVLVLVRFCGRGKSSGLEAEQMQNPGTNLFHVRGGKVTKLVLDWDRDRALADLGLALDGEAR